MKLSTHLAALLSSVLLGSLAAGCSSSEDGVAEGKPLSTASASDAETSRVPPAMKEPSTKVTAARKRCRSAQAVDKPKNDEVLVYFGCDGTAPPKVYSFARPVDPAASLNTRLNTAVAAYFAGPRRQEGNNYLTFAGPEALNSTEVIGTRAVIDLNLDTVEQFTSNTNGHIWTILRSLAFQFPSITEMEPRWNGSCERFGAAMEAVGCSIALRSGQSKPGP